MNFEQNLDDMCRHYNMEHQSFHDTQKARRSQDRSESPFRPPYRPIQRRCQVPGSNYMVGDNGWIKDSATAKLDDLGEHIDKHFGRRTRSPYRYGPGRDSESQHG